MFVPQIVSAQSVLDKGANNPELTNLLGGVMHWIIVPVLEGFFIFTLLMFVWGVVQMIRSGDDPEGRQKGQQHVLWGVVGIAIMFSAYGIIRVIENTITAPAPPFKSMFE